MLAKSLAYKTLKKLDKIQSGKLKLITPDGREYGFGGKNPGHEANITINDWRTFTNIAIRGNIGLAESYRTGRWDSENLQSLIGLGLQNKNHLENFIMGNVAFRKLSALSYLSKLNTIRGSRRNIHNHYDLGNEFYKLWLDPSMSYSSALYKNSNESLLAAQHNKYDRILDCMQTDSGNILEVGCGWGGFAERALEKGDYNIKGITISTEQKNFAEKRLGGAAEIALEDYRVQQGKFDRIVSIEMFEAVGEQFWSTYFGKIRSLLKSNGRAVIQTITMNEKDFPRYRKGADFIKSYIFPGGLLPSPSAFRNSSLKSGLQAENAFFFGPHYARTLEEWLKNFDAKKKEILALGYNEEFIRLWRLYLASCAAAFNHGHINVMQVELRHV